MSFFDGMAVNMELFDYEFIQSKVQSSSTFTPPLKIQILAKKGVNLEHVENTGVKLNKNTIWHYSWFFIVKSSAIEVSPNKRTLEIGEIWSKKGIFPLFLQFLYLKTFDKIPSKSPKPRTEIGFSDHSCQIWTIW